LSGELSCSAWSWGSSAADMVTTFCTVCFLG